MVSESPLASADTDVPLTWRAAIISVFSYALFFTDIPRTGYGFDTLPYVQVGPNEFSVFGPYDYQVANVFRNASTGRIRAFKDKDYPVVSVPLWAYKYDTTSIGMRTILQHYSQLHEWRTCLEYNSSCGSTLEPTTVFQLLEGVMDAVHTFGPTLMLRAQTHYVDQLHHALIPGLLKEKLWRTVVGHVVASGLAPQNGTTLDRICKPAHASTQLMPPLFCDIRWTKLKTLGETSVQTIAALIQAKAMAYELQPHQHLDVVVVEAVGNFIHRTGGLVNIGMITFDVVALYRVRSCDSADRCHTVSLEDYRIEGSLIRTNTIAWYRTLRILRFAGQCYNVLRVLALFLGIYMARLDERGFRTAPFRTKCAAVIKTGLRIPCQVVIYGSWLPTLLFAVSHAIDSPMLYSNTFLTSQTLMGNLSVTPWTILAALSSHMRNVWILSLLYKATLVTYLPTYLAKNGVPGVRGYVLIMVSFASLFLDARTTALRSTELLSTAILPPSAHVGLLRYSAGLPFQLSNSGLWQDVKVLSFAGVAIIFVLHFKFKHIMHVHTKVPHAALVYSGPFLFSTSWFGTMLDPVIYSRKSRFVQVHHDKRRSIDVLMNVAWMTDPINYLHLMWQDPLVYKYARHDRDNAFLHPLPLEQMAIWKGEPPSKFCLVEKTTIFKVPWSRRLLVE